MKIKKGDNVVMLSGKDRGKKGKILSVSPRDHKVVVEGLNLIKRHTRPRQRGQRGQIISKERFVSASSVALVCSSCGKATRVGFQLIQPSGGSGKAGKVRICKKCRAQV